MGGRWNLHAEPANACCTLEGELACQRTRPSHVNVTLNPWLPWPAGFSRSAFPMFFASTTRVLPLSDASKALGVCAAYQTALLVHIESESLSTCFRISMAPLESLESRVPNPDSCASRSARALCTIRSFVDSN